MARGDPIGGQQLVVLEDGDGPSAHRSMGAIEARGGQVLHRYGDRVLICAAPPRAAEAINALKSVRAVHAKPVSRAPRGASTEEELGIEAWNLSRSKRFAEAKAERPRDGVAWDAVGGLPEAPDGPGMTHVTEEGPQGQIAEQRGFFMDDLSPYLRGSVAVGIIIVNGPTPDLQFSDAEKTKVVAEVQLGLGFLASYEPRASVSFSYDIKSVDIANPPDPRKSGYELLEAHWRDPALASLGYMANILGARQHAEKIRGTLGTRWAYTALFTKYPTAHFAYALKPKIVMQYDNDGWGPDNIDRVFAHESGHIFGCPDEYASSNCNCSAKFGWFREPNGNCQNCATPFVDCLMASNTFAMCEHTPIQLGWRDIDHDGVLDDTSNGQLFDYRKFCSAVPLVCQLIGLSPPPPPPGTQPAPGAAFAGIAGSASGSATTESATWPGGGVPMLLLERTLGPDELARVEAAARAEELEYLIRVEQRLRAALRQVRDYRSALEVDAKP